MLRFVLAAALVVEDSIFFGIMSFVELFYSCERLTGVCGDCGTYDASSPTGCACPTTSPK